MSDGAPVGPDPIVQTALQLLPVPDHGPAFWDELDAQLELEAPLHREPPLERRVTPPPSVEPALAAGPQLLPDGAVHAPRGPRPSRPLPGRAGRAAPGTADLLPPALRRRSNAVLAAVALVAAIVVLVAGATLVRERSLGQTDGAAADGSADRSTTTTARDAAADGAPERAVLEWVRALGAEDMATAWAALGPASQAHFGSRAAFDQERSALAEGYGAWADAAPDRVIVTPVPSGGEAVLVVVTLVGTVHQEGATVRRADAIPVRLADGSAVVEPFAFAGEVDITVPGPARRGAELPLVQADDELVVTVPRGVIAPTIRIDGHDPVVCGDDPTTALTEPPDAPGQRCTYRPDQGLEAGRRVLTVAFASPDGSMVSARSVLFEVA